MDIQCGGASGRRNRKSLSTNVGNILMIKQDIIDESQEHGDLSYDIPLKQM
jgi:hypothetical protein